MPGFSLFFSIFFSSRWLLPDDCYLAKWFDDQREFFKQGGERGTIYFADFNLDNDQLERITRLVKNLKNETTIITEVDHWAVEFSERFHNGSLDEDPGEVLGGVDIQGHLNNVPMIKKLGQFLKTKEGLYYRDRFYFENNAKPSCVEKICQLWSCSRLSSSTPCSQARFISSPKMTKKSSHSHSYFFPFSFLLLLRPNRARASYGEGEATSG